MKVQIPCVNKVTGMGSGLVRGLSSPVDLFSAPNYGYRYRNISHALEIDAKKVREHVEAATSRFKREPDKSPFDSPK